MGGRIDERGQGKVWDKCNIDLDNPVTPMEVSTELGREALTLCANEDSQIRKLCKQVNQDLSSPVNTRDCH